MTLKIKSLLVLLFVCTFLTCASPFLPQAEARWGEPMWGEVANLSSIALFVVAEKEDGTFLAHKLPAGKTLVLPKGTVRVTALPGELPDPDFDVKIAVDVFRHRKSHRTSDELGTYTTVGQINEAGASVTFKSPTSYYTVGGLPKRSPERCIFALGSRQQDEQKKTDPGRILRTLNSSYIEHSERLEEIAADSEEAKAIRRALPILEKEIKELIAEERQRYGDQWKERHRDPVTRTLPGGFIKEDEKRFHPTVREKHVVKGYVYHKPSGESWPEFYLPAWHGGYYWDVIAGEPLKDCTVFIKLGYCQIPNEKLFDEFERLMKTKIEIGRKLRRGIRKISQDEYRDYLLLGTLKEKLAQVMTYEAGCRPAWRAKTNAGGEFEFPVDKFPGKDGVVFLRVTAAAFPPFDTPTSISRWNQSLVDYYPFYDDLIKRKSTREEDPEITRLEDELHSLRLSVLDEEERLLDARDRLRQLRDQWKRPEHIERSWEERAQKDQLTFEKAFKTKHGPSRDWDEKTKKEYMDKLAEIPERSQGEWGKDLATYKQKREAALNPVVAEIAKVKKEIKKDINKINELGEKYDRLLEAEMGYGYDLAINLEADPTYKHMYKTGGNFSGKTITPQAQAGYDTEVYLIKQTVDKDFRQEEMVAHTFVDGRTSYVSINLNDPKAPKPPFTFDFPENLTDHVIIYKAHRIEGNHLGVGSVSTIFDSGSSWAPSAMNLILPGLDISPVVEVEGFPITDRKQYIHLRRRLETLEWKSITTSRHLKQLARDFEAGKIDFETLRNKNHELNESLRSDTQESVNVWNGLAKINPAFHMNAKKKILEKRE